MCVSFHYIREEAFQRLCCDSRRRHDVALDQIPGSGNEERGFEENSILRYQQEGIFLFPF